MDVRSSRIPAASAPASTARSRSSRSPSSASAARLRAPRDRAQPPRRRRRCAPRGAVFVDDPATCREGAAHLQRPRRLAGGARGRRAARAARDRRDLPARHQGARRGPAHGEERLRHRDDRPQGPRRGRGHHGPGPDRMHLVESVEDVAKLEVRRPLAARLRHPDDALGGRHPRHPGGAAASASRRSGCRARTTSATRPRTARTR